MPKASKKTELPSHKNFDLCWAGSCRQDCGKLPSADLTGDEGAGLDHSAGQQLERATLGKGIYEGHAKVHLSGEQVERLNRNHLVLGKDTDHHDPSPTCGQAGRFSDGRGHTRAFKNEVGAAGPSRSRLLGRGEGDARPHSFRDTPTVGRPGDKHGLGPCYSGELQAEQAYDSAAYDDGALARPRGRDVEGVDAAGQRLGERSPVRA